MYNFSPRQHPRKVIEATRSTRPVKRCFLSVQLILAVQLLLTAHSFAAYQASPTPGPATVAQPDILIFTNGDQLTGTLIRGVGDSVVFRSDMAGEITVPLSKVKELRSATSFAVIRKDVPLTRTPVQSRTVRVDDGSVTVSSAPPQVIPDQQLAFIIDESTYTRELAGHNNLLSGWNGAITAGASLVRSTQTGTTVNAGISAVRAIPSVAYLPRRFRTTFNLNETYGKFRQPIIPQTTPATPDSTAKTNIFHADLEQDRYFSPHFYVLATTSFDHNYAQGLDLQQVYGGGIGWTAAQSARQQLDLTVNIHYEKQSFQAGANDQSLIGATLAESYRRDLPGRLVFTEFADFLPAFNNTHAYSANLAAGLALPVYHRLSISLNTTDNYLNDPSPGYKRNSYQFATGLIYTLR